MIERLYIQELEEILKLMEREKEYNSIIWASYMKIIKFYNNGKNKKFNDLMIIDKKRVFD